MIIFKVRKICPICWAYCAYAAKNNLMLLIRKGPILVLLQTASHRRVRDNAFVLRQPPCRTPLRRRTNKSNEKHFSPAEKSVFHFHKAARNFRRALARGSVSRARSFCVVNLRISPRRTPDRFPCGCRVLRRSCCRSRFLFRFRGRRRDRPLSFFRDSQWGCAYICRRSAC